MIIVSPIPVNVNGTPALVWDSLTNEIIVDGQGYSTTGIYQQITFTRPKTTTAGIQEALDAGNLVYVRAGEYNGTTDVTVPSTAQVLQELGATFSGFTVSPTITVGTVQTPGGWSVKDDGSGNLEIEDTTGTLVLTIYPESNSNGLKFNNPYGSYSLGGTNGSISGRGSGLVNFWSAAGGNGTSLLSISITGFSTLFGINTSGLGLPPIYGLDNRTGLTAADSSAKTLYTTTAAGQFYRVSARILATSGTSATYKIVWTEGGTTQSVSLTVSAANTLYSNTFTIQPDSGTAITAQLTAVTSSTVNVGASVEELA